MLEITEQTEGIIRTEVKFDVENSEELYIVTEKAVKDLANSINKTNTYFYNRTQDQRFGKKNFSRERSYSKEQGKFNIGRYDRNKRREHQDFRMRGENKYHRSSSRK